MTTNEGTTIMTTNDKVDLAATMIDLVNAGHAADDRVSIVALRGGRYAVMVGARQYATGLTLDGLLAALEIVRQ